jgi:hypothetical protein
VEEKSGTKTLDLVLLLKCIGMIQNTIVKQLILDLNPTAQFNIEQVVLIILGFSEEVQ